MLEFESDFCPRCIAEESSYRMPTRLFLAGQILSGMLSSSNNFESKVEIATRIAFKYADALIEKAANNEN